MNERKPVLLVLGDHGKAETLPRVYEPDAAAFLQKCRRTAMKYSVVHTSDDRVVTAFQRLHKAGEVELLVKVVKGDFTHEIRFSERGEMIDMWPDEFFEIGFHLRFADFDEKEK